MLDSETKRKIDNCRDILVGKLPDPKSQIEQITIALIYKFMDDMDKQSEELGGKQKFFTEEFEKYSWSNLVSPKISGHELISYYNESLLKMNQNKNIPQLFRDIFKNAYLPYRDPETLKSFLKEIDWFNYDHSEKLGDAFEYLLSVMGSQGDAGQFRTPRHLIDFIVKVINPEKNESVLDPACGTAGFLISAYKHILDKNRDKNGKIILTPDEKKRLINNFVGYDISPDMVRLSLVNLYLHGFPDPKIFEYDTLTSEERWNEQFEVIMANPPFMTPKGGIKPHKRFSVQANRSEVLFVDYIAEHLTPQGRAGIVVPEGIIFQSGNAYRQLRKMLLDNSLYAVISLPAGVFNPYSGVKTSVLLLDKSLVKKTDKILFIKVENDGYGLGAQRREVSGSDLPIALDIITKYVNAIKNGKEKDFALSVLEQKKALIIQKSELADDFNLSQDRYRTQEVYAGSWPLVELDEVCDMETGSREKGGAISQGVPSIGGEQISENGSIKQDKMKYVSEEHFNQMRKGILRDNDILMVKDGATTGKMGFYTKLYEKAAINEHVYLIRAKDQILPGYLFNILRSNYFQDKLKNYVKGIIGGISSEIKEIKIPLPPLEIQEKIVVELESYQNIIEGARKVVSNYKPSFKIDPNWEMVEIKSICEIERGASPRPIDKYITKNESGINWIKIGDTKGVTKYINETREKITPEGAKKSRSVKEGDFILSNSMSFGRPYIMKTSGCIHDGWLLLRVKEKSISKDYLYYVLGSIFVAQQFEHAATGGVVRNLNSELVKQVKIPLPPLEIQKQIAQRIEEEQKLVDSNNQIIKIFENKIKEKIREVWGEGAGDGE